MQRLTSTLTLRPLTIAESECPTLLPPELRDFQFPLPSPDWTWIVEHHNSPIGLILTSPVGSILLIWRVLATSSARRVSNWLLATLPAILENARLRGCVGYGAFFHDDKPVEAHLARIFQRAGGHLEPFVGSFCIAPIGSVECLTSESPKSLLSQAS